MTAHAWFHVENEAEIASPALLLYQERIEHNLQLMLKIAGGPERLRPHVKTHKLLPLIQRQVELGITKFKAATIAEAEMCATGGARDVLLSMPCVGPNGQRLAQLALKFPTTKFSAIADDEATLRTLAAAAQQNQVTLGVFLELDCGMGRTGIFPGEAAAYLAHVIKDTPRLQFCGLHAYDGHIHDADLETRRARCEVAYAPILDFRQRLIGEGVLVPELVAGGSPTFGIHAALPDRTFSPGTCVFWDFGYGDKYPDLPFLPAAALLARVISKPGVNRLTLDLGHKSVAPENPHPRVRFEELPDAEVLMQSEEHLVLQTDRAHEFEIGQSLHGIPRHVCPSVSMHGEAVVIEGGLHTATWPVTARNRRMTV
ncbi:D-serine deaminase-like pyridoxal phosphate-dependent protein [Prosthecobacter fusiformis]|uniref:D-serine deaminase-like pyridoxal phosphate-dependent protein n=1 Tax=Prosthecobacter fusiformis TaxID=48464 RepID=A0A4R7RYS6_9BACT|nr:D-TA family PLP-dependent enzyme [Prosthecobacter fusiformis]TDU71052.1 D-serine deaminase-like pyridoxal phosphate-dependent protein [Prosthecobacter fusiformis]